MTLKLATSLDGRIAAASGESRWITGEEARAAVHGLRADHDAVVIGIETALADDPELTVRSPGYAGRQPARVVLDSHGRLPAGSRMARTAHVIPTFVIHNPSSPGSTGRPKPPASHAQSAQARDPASDLVSDTSLDRPVEPGDDENKQALDRIGVRRIEVQSGPDGRPDLAASVAALTGLGLGRLLVEGGGEVAAGFLRAGLVDRIEWFRAPIVLGAEGRPSIGALALAQLSDAPRFRRVSAEPLGEDLWERYERR